MDKLFRFFTLKENARIYNLQVDVLTLANLNSYLNLKQTMGVKELLKQSIRVEEFHA